MSKILVIEDENIIQKFLEEIAEENVIKIETSTKANILYCKDIVLNKENYEVLKNGGKIELTVREFDILRILIENQNKVFSRDKLLNLVWGYDYYGDPNIVNTHIKNIRKKIGNEYIKTVRGIGYKI